MDDKYMIWLAHAYDIDAKAIDYLLERFENAEGIFRAREGEIYKAKSVHEKALSKIVHLKKNLDPDKALSDMQNKGIKFISKFQVDYPPLLKTIANPPLGLFVLGILPGFDKLWLSVIGTRKPTSYGSAVTYKLSKELAEKGVVIASGMADGLDGMAHKAALDAGGLTVAVLGSGADICYPGINEGIYEKIKETGAIISEYPPGTPPSKWNFPRRNRIISGLSLGLLLVEAEIASGTSITVSCALAQGREIMAVPGNITNPKSAGPNTLIREGAHVATCARDIFDALGFIEAHSLNNSNEEIHNKEHIPLATEYETVYSLLDDEPMDLDDIIIKTGLKPRTIMVALTKLKFEGLVSELHGQKYIRSRI